MNFIADGVLIAASLTTALYCLVLSRRLRRLGSTDAGIGKQIETLNESLDETRRTVGELRRTAGAASEQLNREIAEARRQAAQLARLVARAGERDNGQPRGHSGGGSPPPRLFVPPTAGPRDAEPAGEAAPAPDKAADAAAPDGPGASPAPEDSSALPDVAAAAADEVLASGTGEAQLGFLPDDEALQGKSPELELGIGPDQASDSASAETGDDEQPGDSDAADPPDDPPDPAGRDEDRAWMRTRLSPGPNSPGGAPKVERMAL